MARIFGAASAVSVETRLTNGYQLYDWVMRMNSFPAFWGRNISGEGALTAEEVEFLQEKKCKIALVFNDLSEVAVSTNDGTMEALQAVEAAKTLGVSQDKGIALFAKFASDWSLHHNWMMSYAQAVVRNGFVPGFIGNTDSSINFNFDRQCSHYVQATQEMEEYGAVYWATEPKSDCEIKEWSPFCPSALTTDKIALWSVGQIKLNDISANVTYARDVSVLEHMW